MKEAKLESLAIAAFLERGENRIPVTAKYASKYSLWIKYLNDFSFTPDDTFKLIIPKNGTNLELCPCQLVLDPDQDGQNGRLVFLKDIVDVHKLLTQTQISKLQSAFGDLSNLLTYKDKVKKSFKEYTADLTYDISVYKILLDQIDLQYKDEPPSVKNVIQKAIIETEGCNFNKFIDKSLFELEAQVKYFSTEEHQIHSFYFRKQLWNFIMCSPLMARSNLKPRGYSGDSEIMKMLYSNEYLGDSTFAKLLQKHGVEHTAAQSVRNRINLITQLLFNFQKKTLANPTDKLNILSIGSGPALELQKILKSPQDCCKFHFTLFDQDPVALSEALGLSVKIGKQLKASVDVDIFKGSVRTLLYSSPLKHKAEQFHYIYSLGLFDYLSAPVAKALVSSLYRMLVHGGEMVIGNFHISNPSKYYMEYWCDWVLKLRSEDDLLEFTSDLSGSNYSIIFENTKSQMFLHIKKS